MTQGAQPHAGDPWRIFWEFIVSKGSPLCMQFFERFFCKWQKNAKSKGTMQGARPHAGDAWGIFLELFEFCTATEKATPPSAGDIFLKHFFFKYGKNVEKKTEYAGGVATPRGRHVNIFGIVDVLRSHRKGNTPLRLGIRIDWIFVNIFFQFLFSFIYKVRMLNTMLKNYLFKKHQTISLPQTCNEMDL